MMYSAESIHTRFAEHTPYGSNADHFICVIYTGGEWKYDNNSAYYAFDPRETDILVASVDFTNDTVTSLSGQSGEQDGIAKGYQSGNLVFTANMFAGVPNGGEFYITGTSFAPNTLVEVLRYYYAGAARIAMRGYSRS